MTSLPVTSFAHPLVGAALVLSFGLLCHRRTHARIAAYGGQGAVLAAVVAWKGYHHEAADLYGVAAILLLAKSALIPWSLRRIARRTDHADADEAALNVPAMMALGVGLVALSLLVAGPGEQQILAFALAIGLLGLLTIVTRRTALTQAIGFLAMENGLGLAIYTGAPQLAALSLATLALIGVVVVVVSRIGAPRAS